MASKLPAWQAIAHYESHYSYPCVRYHACAINTPLTPTWQAEMVRGGPANRAVKRAKIFALTKVKCDRNGEGI